MNALTLPCGTPTLMAPFCIAARLFLLPQYKLDNQDVPTASDWKPRKLIPALPGGCNMAKLVPLSEMTLVVFRIALNAGPHLVTYIVPSRIYSVAERGAGMGIATMPGKIGAVLGVLFMPTLLSLGAVVAVLSMSILVQLAGAPVTLTYGKRLNLI